MDSQEHLSVLGESMGENGCYDKFVDGILAADDIFQTVFEKIGDHITVMEVIAKIPDYNTCLAIELSVMSAGMRGFQQDERSDDCYLPCEDEPTSIGKDNYMVECIELLP